MCCKVCLLGQRKHTTTLNRDVHTHTHRWVRGYAHDLQICQDGVCLCTLDKERQLESEHRMAGWIIKRRYVSLSISHDMSLKSWVVIKGVAQGWSSHGSAMFSLCVCLFYEEKFTRHGSQVWNAKQLNLTSKPQMLHKTAQLNKLQPHGPFDHETLTPPVGRTWIAILPQAIVVIDQILTIFFKIIAVSGMPWSFAPQPPNCIRKWL